VPGKFKKNSWWDKKGLAEDGSTLVRAIISKSKKKGLKNTDDAIEEQLKK